MLGRARELGRRRSRVMTPDVVAVALGWMRGEITLKAAGLVLGTNNSAGTYQRLALAIREGWQEGLIHNGKPSQR